MKSKVQKEPMIFDIHVAEGSHYEVGKQRAITLKQHYPEDILYYIRPMEGQDYISAATAHKRMMIIDKICPGFTEEVQGFADEVNMEPEKIICYANSYHNSPHCCQFAVLPSNTSDGHCYVGRSYEYFVRDERSLCITRVTGKPKHIGFSLQLAGRTDGMNEYGLVVSMSSTAYLKPLGRYSSVWNSLLREAPHLNDEKVKNLLSTPYPYGPCCHFYASGMGTLRSMVFNITAKKLQVSFGPPDMNPWHSIDFDAPVRLDEIICRYDNANISNPEQFWRELESCVLPKWNEEKRGL